MTPSRPLRVLQLGSPNGLYGAERWILALVKHLPRGEITSIVGSVKDTPGTDPEICRYAAGLSLETQVFEAYGKMSWGAVGQIRRYIRDAGIDVLHTHFYKTDLLGLLATRGTNCRLVSTPHGWSAQAGLKLQAYEALDRVIFPFFDAVAPLSPDLYDGLRGIPGLLRKLHLIPNGVDLSEVEAARAPESGSEPALPPDRFTIGYIGQLIARKRIDTLIEAFARLRVPGKYLCLIGQGPEQARFERLAHERGVGDAVRFCGYRADRLALLKGFDVFVLPSELEGIPRCLMESMGAGVATVASDVPGCRDIVKHERTGLLFKLGDAGELAACLERLAGNAGLRRTLGEAGRRFVYETYSAESMAKS
ncbi:MAG TPA: glycosyltransferase, partial [Steroidobacteraceae bacterium]|nr:glycosyltransferase [Steroidobacteraceae bacterium]